MQKVKINLLEENIGCFYGLEVGRYLFNMTKKTNYRITL